MRYFLSALLVGFFIFLLTSILSSPVQATHTGNGKKDQCGNYSVSRGDCGPAIDIIRDIQPFNSSCSYDEATYDCPNESNPGSIIRCIQRSPLDCGPGVTVCGGPTVNDGYNCTKWCSDVYSDYTRPCEILRDTNTVTTDDNYGVYDSTLGRYTNKRNDYCYWGDRCLGPGGTAPCDDRLACTDYVNQCVINIKNDCQTNECTNAGTLPTNACPGDVQCDPTHSCVFQQPVIPAVTSVLPPTVAQIPPS